MSFIFGTFLGSFANACIWRIPRNISILRPGSFCTSCMKTIPIYLNIPVLSWFILKGKCYSCAEPFSFRYPLIELITGFITALWFYRFGYSPDAFIFTYLGLILIIISVIDIDFRIIAPQLSYPLMLTGIILSPFNSLIDAPGVSALLKSALGLVIGGGVIWLVRIVGSKAFGKEAMGLGDVKLMMGIGAFTGPAGIFWTIFAASLFGSLVGVSLKIAGKLEKFGYIPFGPFLAAGGVFYIHFSNYFSSYWYFPLT